MIISIPFIGFSQENKYEYLIITKHSNRIYITIGSEKFEEIKIEKDETDHLNFDFRPLLQRIADFEQKGWEFVTGGPDFNGGVGSFTILMRKIKE